MKEIYQGDCVIIMDQLINKGIRVDLTITSPPYDNIRNYNGNNDQWNEAKWKQVLDKLYAITKDGGVVVWVVGDATIKGSETGTSFKQALYAKEIGFNLHDTMIYQKDSISFPETNRYYPIFEYMFIFSKGKPITTNLISDRQNKYADGKKRIYGRERQEDGELIGRRKGNLLKPYGIRFNIWRYAVGMNKSATDNIAYQHPAIFPEELAQDHILSWSNENDLILDPFMGSGTTGKMATLHNRQFIGIEIEEKYCEMAVKRLQQSVLEF